MSQHRAFWDKEYKSGEHLTLSTEPAEDLLKFCRFLERAYGGRILNVTSRVLDIGCGNGRNLIFLGREYSVHGYGFDISAEAIKQAQQAAGNLPLEFSVRSMTDPLPAEAESVDLVLDMMSSHFLRAAERANLRDDIVRVLKPGSWFFFKSFLAEEDLHVKRLLREHPADEPNSYIHPELGVLEHVWTIPEIHEHFGQDFIIHKIDKSHKHLARGRAWKRRTVSVYLEKKA